MPKLKYDDFEPFARAAFDGYVASLEAESEPVEAEPAATPVATVTVQGTSNGEWKNGFSTQRAMLIFADNAANKAALLVGRILQFADGTQRTITSSSASFNVIYVGYSGDKLTPIAGQIGVYEAGKLEAPTETVSAPSEPAVVETPAALELPLIGVNFAGLGNNPSVDAVATASAPTNYRTIVPVYSKTTQPDYIEMYRPKGEMAGKPWLARIPFAGERIAVLDGKGGFTLRETYVAEILAVIRALAAANCSVLLDMHNYCRWYIPVGSAVVGRSMGNYNGNLSLWSAIGHPECPVSYELLGQIWAAIAERFMGEPNIFAWGLMNEPHNQAGKDPVGYDIDKTWKETGAQLLINAIRKVDMVNAISVCGGFYGQAKTWLSTSAGLENLVDPADNFFVEAHQYPDNKGGGGGQWTRDKVTGVLVEESVDAAARAADWDPFLNWLKQHKKRGIAGEFGGPGDLPGMQDYFCLLYDKFESAGVPSFQWLAGPGDSDTYPNGMDRNNGALKPNADEFVKRVGRTVASYGYP